MAVMWWIPLRFIARATISRGRGDRGAAEGFPGGLLPELLHGRALLLGAVPQPLEQRGVEARLGRRDLEQGDPQAPLPGDAGEEALQLDQAAQRRVAREVPVQLQAAGL